MRENTKLLHGYKVLDTYTGAASILSTKHQLFITNISMTIVKNICTLVFQIQQ